jgi:hypothetical protein
MKKDTDRIIEGGKGERPFTARPEPIRPIPDGYENWYEVIGRVWKSNIPTLRLVFVGESNTAVLLLDGYEMATGHADICNKLTECGC